MGIKRIPRSDFPVLWVIGILPNLSEVEIRFMNDTKVVLAESLSGKENLICFWVSIPIYEDLLYAFMRAG